MNLDAKYERLRREPIDGNKLQNISTPTRPHGRDRRPSPPSPQKRPGRTRTAVLFGVGSLLLAGSGFAAGALLGGDDQRAQPRVPAEPAPVSTPAPDPGPAPLSLHPIKPANGVDASMTLQLDGGTAKWRYDVEVPGRRWQLSLRRGAYNLRLIDGYPGSSSHNITSMTTSRFLSYKSLVLSLAVKTRSGKTRYVPVRRLSTQRAVSEMTRRAAP